MSRQAGRAAPGAPGAVFDLLIIGGGINGAGIARDAAGRGHSVCLCEAGDFARGTSSASTKLIHGGLRYLEYYEFRLVREALKEREVLWRMAPHVIRPLRFVLPVHKGLRPAWMLRLGLFLYDHLGGRRLLPPTKTVKLSAGPLGKPLKPLFRKGFEYSDCWVEDARLVILNALDAAQKGADIRPRTRVLRARREGNLWLAEIEGQGGARETLRARAIVNAAGPWVDQVLRDVFARPDPHNVRLVRGSHIVVPRLFAHDRAYIFQNADGRIIFAIPFEGDFTLIGTTDCDQGHDPENVRITPEEIAYLCAAASEYFAAPVRQEDVVWTYSGVRPLYDDGASKAQEATRDYVLKLEGGAGEAALLNIFGGKITTYRRLAEAALERLGGAIGRKGQPWTADSHLPGGEFGPREFDSQVACLLNDFPFLGQPLATRLVRLYGTRARRFLGRATGPGDLGRDFGAGLHEAEIRYLVDQEWAREADDVLYRRTRLGLHMNAGQREAVQAYLAGREGRAP